MVKKFVDQRQIDLISSGLNALALENDYGVRDIVSKVPVLSELACSPSLLSLVCGILGEGARPVRSVYFNKTLEKNWNVAWHQDTSIAVNAKVEVPGFTKWRLRQGIYHVEPPVEYLSNMLTLRIHLDEANQENGVLRVVPGSHKLGRVPSEALLDIVDKSEVVECNANAGDILMMSPLLFHSSRKAHVPGQRRIVHIEYSAKSLPSPLSWFSD